MRKWTCVVVLAALLGASCSKEKINVVSIKQPEANNVVFTEYTLKKGEQESNHGYQFLQADTLAFTVKFDTSCKYKTIDPLNQIDINKLYGFSDNNKEHHQFSARFGWYYNEGKLTLHAYVYNDGVRSSRIIRNINFLEEVKCGIVAKPGKYIFRVGADTIQMPRTSTTAKAEGYKLYPYFGGDEFAPHDMKIWIRDDKSL